MISSRSTALPSGWPTPVGTIVRRTTFIALMAFLTVVDLFGTQAILPALGTAYGVSPAAMGSAVNASTLGMAVGGLLVALAGRRIDRTRGIVTALVLLAVPTALLATMPSLPVFALLRVAQGLCMAAAFALTVAHLGERCSAEAAAGALAAYVAGNVASNLFGRLLAASLAEHLGLGPSFLGLASLNLAGAVLAYLGISRGGMLTPLAPPSLAPVASLRKHLAQPSLRAAFAIGFCILFAFIGTFTYVNFVLSRSPIGLSQMQLGLVYLVFAPSIVTTLSAGRVAAKCGAPLAIRSALVIAGLGLPLLLVPSLAAILAGLTLVGIGTFFAQAIATAFVSRTAMSDRGSAGGLYLASYFLGGLAGSFLLGTLFDRFGWSACVTGIAASLGSAALLAGWLRPAPAMPSAMR